MPRYLVEVRTTTVTTLEVNADSVALAKDHAERLMQPDREKTMGPLSPDVVRSINQEQPHATKAVMLKKEEYGYV